MCMPPRAEAVPVVEHEARALGLLACRGALLVQLARSWVQRHEDSLEGVPHDQRGAVWVEQPAQLVERWQFDVIGPLTSIHA